MKTELMTPRAVPGRILPAAAAGLVVLLALPVFLVAGWSVKGWALGAVLWAGLELLSFVLGRLRARNEGASPHLQAIELFVKAVAVLAVVLAAAKSDGNVALGAVLTFALGYTLELMLSMATYFGNEK